MTPGNTEPTERTRGRNGRALGDEFPAGAYRAAGTRGELSEGFDVPSRGGYDLPLETDALGTVVTGARNSARGSTAVAGPEFGRDVVVGTPFATSTEVTRALDRSSESDRARGFEGPPFLERWD